MKSYTETCTYETRRQIKHSQHLQNGYRITTTAYRNAFAWHGKYKTSFPTKAVKPAMAPAAQFE